MWGEKTVSPDGREAVTTARYDITAEKEHDALLNNVLDGLEARVALYRVEPGAVLKLLKNSRNVMRSTHYTDEEYRELCKEDAIDFVYAPDRDRVRSVVRRSVRDNIAVTEHFRLLDKRDGYAWVTAMVSSMGNDGGFPAVRIVFMPLSLQSDLQLQILDSEFMGVYVIDDESDEVYYANNASLQIFGVPEATMFLGKACHEVFFQRDRPCDPCWRSLPLGEDDVVRTKAGKTVSIKVQRRIWNGRNIAVVYCRDITEQQRLQEEMRRKNEQLSVILKAVPGGLKCSRDDETYSYVFVSEQVANLFGYTLDEYMQATGGGAVGAVYPPDLPRVLKGLEEDFAKGPDYAQKYRVRCKDGTLKWILDCGRRMKDEQGNDVFNSLYLDVTDAEEADISRKRQTELLESMYNTVPCGILRLRRVDANYEILTCNSAAWRLATGQEQDRPAGFWKNGMAETLVPEDRQLILESYGRLQHPGDCDEVDCHVRWFDGSVHILHRSSFLISSEGGVQVLQCIFMDITESKTLRDALEEARVASRAKTDFLSRMSHDIRTPLNGVLGMTELALKENRDPNVQADLETVRSSGRFLLSLINDILDISRIEEGKLELHPAPLKLEAFDDMIRSVVFPLMQEKDITFEYRMDCGLQCAMVDEVRFSQLFFNLLSNAAKFTPQGGHVVFSAEALPCDACNGQVGSDACSDKIEWVRFCVRDNGIGMTEEFQRIAFDSFSQMYDPSYSGQRHQGTGLGLTIVQELVALMGGKVSLTSEPGKGTEFLVDLPMERCPMPGNDEPAGRDDETTAESLSGAHVLLAEDNDINRHLAKRLLGYVGVQVTDAPNGKEALAAFTASAPGTFDAILMDVRMPVMDGLEATRRIRALARPDAATIPIVAMTANAFEEDVESCRACGMNEHLAKPVQPERLYRVLAQHVARRQQ